MAAFNNPNLAILELVAQALGPVCESVIFVGSHDLEDIITVADRRPELLGECRAAAPELRAYLAEEFTALFANSEFEQALSGHLPGDAFSQQRARPLANTLRELSTLSA